MTQPTGSIDILFPLNRFYESEQLALPSVANISPDELPQPYRDLLAHNRDMTPTLEAFFKETITITIIHKGQQGDAYTREVVLSTTQSHKPVSYGSIDIHLENVPAEARADILTGKLPFGTILHLHRIPHLSAPSAFFEFESDPVTQRHFGLTEPTHLYGRHNRLSTPDRRILAEVVEILAPV